MRAGDLVGCTGDFGGGRPDDDVGDSTPWQVTVSGAPPRVAVPPPLGRAVRWVTWHGHRQPTGIQQRLLGRRPTSDLAYYQRFKMLLSLSESRCGLSISG
jgi:hypothetical protein